VDVSEAYRVKNQAGLKFWRNVLKTETYRKFGKISEGTFQIIWYRDSRSTWM